jgi:hypothetical protein
VQKKIGRLLYSVAGETELGDETALVIADNEAETAQYARTVLGFEVITAITLASDCVYV